MGIAHQKRATTAFFAASAPDQRARELGQELCLIGDPGAATTLLHAKTEGIPSAKVEVLHRTPVTDEELQLADGRNMLALQSRSRPS
jgi:hypothetical protein